MCCENELIAQKEKYIPDPIVQRVKTVTIENGGVYYKTGKGVTTGSEFIRQFQDHWLTETLTQLPNVTLLVVSEEKYHFTPDLF